MLFAAVAFCPVGRAQVILRVNIGAPHSGGNGSSWPQAYRFVQDALAAAGPIAAGGQEVQLWIAAGRHTPDQSAASPAGTKDRAESFAIPARVALYGGFAGTEAMLSERDPATNLTILSGDLNNDDGPVLGDGPRTDNSYHVVVVGAGAPGARIDGLRVSGGFGGDLDGAGAILNAGTLTLDRCVVTMNSGGDYFVGSGAVVSTGTLTVLNSTFTQNISGFLGGSSIIALGPATTIIGCDFVQEISFGGGAAVKGHITAASCRFVFSVGTSFFPDLPVGGAFHGSGRLIGCAFVFCAGGLTGEGLSGAVLCESGDLEVVNCTFVRNRADTSALLFMSPGALTLSNSLLWQNFLSAPTGDEGQGAQVSILDGTAAVNHCYIQDLDGSLGGEGNIGGDPNKEPRILDWLGPDGEPGTADDDVRLSPGSPCIDAGSSALLPPDELDLDGDGDTSEPWPLDLDSLTRRVDVLSTPDTGAGPAPVVDIGAHEFQGGASVWSNPAGGDYFAGANWAPGPPPDPSKDLEFDLPESYTVQLSQPATCGRIIAGGGAVSLQLGGGALTAGAPYGDALTIAPWDNAAASLAVHSGTLAAARCLIAPGGTLEGTGTLAGAVRNSGTIAPAGPDRGELTIDGSVVMQAVRSGDNARAGVLHMDIAGDQPGQFDRLVVNGTAALSGGLFVRTPPGFVPPPGMSVELVRVRDGVDIGRFDVAFLPGLKDGRIYKVDYPESGGAVTLSVLDLGGGLSFDSKNGTVNHAVTAIAVGLLDDDALPDLAVATSDGFVILLFNGGNGPGGWNGFTSQIQFSSGGLDPRGLVIADFDPANSNGNEIAVANAGSDSVVIFSRPAGPAWTPVATLPVGSRPSGIGAADFDQNGSIDLAVANFLSNTVSVRANASSLSIAFVSRPDVITDQGPTSVEPWDSDNTKDIRSLAIANTSSGTMTLHTGNGDGTFAARTTWAVGAGPVRVLHRDLNVDGRTDFLTVNRAANSVSVLLRNDSGGLNLAVNMPVGGDPSSITAVDIDNDGDPDLAVAAEDSPGSRVVQLLRNNILPGDFTVAFASPIDVKAAKPPTFLDHADFDQDGFEDILAVSADGTEATDNVTVRLNRWRDCPADFDRNSWVNGDDADAFLSAYDDGDPTADLNGDGVTAVGDFDLFVSHFVAGC